MQSTHLAQAPIYFARTLIFGILFLNLSGCSKSTVDSPTSSADPAATSSPQSSPAASQTTVKIAGSSSTMSMLKALAAAYEQKGQGVKIEFPTSSDSEGAIASVKNNLLNIAGSSHALKPEEDNGQLQYRQAAQDLLMVATHRSVTGVTNLTTDQLKDIYGGKITNWQEVGGPDAEIVVVDRPENESAKKLLREHYLGTEKTTDKAVILPKENELIEAIQSTPNSIGAFSLATAIAKNIPVTRLKLNDVEPTAANLENGSYKMVRSLGVIWNKTASPETQAFIDFIFSAEGTAALEKSGYTPAKTK